MKNKYAENIELSRQKSRDNYYRNKNSTYNQNKRIKTLIDKLYVEIELLIKNEDCECVLENTKTDLNDLLDIFHS